MMKMMVTMRKNFRPLAEYWPIFTQYTTSAPKRKPGASAGTRKIFRKTFPGTLKKPLRTPTV